MSLHIPYESDSEQMKHVIRFKENSIEASTSRLTDVKIAKLPDETQAKEKIIYPGEDIEKYKCRGYSITDGKRYVKIETDLTKQFGIKNGKSINLMQNDALEAFIKHVPDASEIIKQCKTLICDKSTEKQTLNESLLIYEKQNGFESGLQQSPNF